MAAMAFNQHCSKILMQMKTNLYYTHTSLFNIMWYLCKVHFWYYHGGMLDAQRALQTQWDKTLENEQKNKKTFSLCTLH
jgi:hypothetical protein